MSQDLSKSGREETLIPVLTRKRALLLLKKVPRNLAPRLMTTNYNKFIIINLNLFLHFGVLGFSCFIRMNAPIAPTNDQLTLPPDLLSRFIRKFANVFFKIPQI